MLRVSSDATIAWAVSEVISMMLSSESVVPATGLDPTASMAESLGWALAAIASVRRFFAEPLLSLLIALYSSTRKGRSYATLPPR